tara:strand:+ start:197 stop:430 length:234 start_codon:yes stop_codon:yes gene_type:complete
MKEIAEKQMLEWQEELKLHKERLAQAQAVIEQETKLIAMIEGGIQFGDSLLKKNESSTQQTDTVELDQQSKTAPSKK